MIGKYPQYSDIYSNTCRTRVTICQISSVYNIFYKETKEPLEMTRRHSLLFYIDGRRYVDPFYIWKTINIMFIAMLKFKSSICSHVDSLILSSPIMTSPNLYLTWGAWLAFVQSFAWVLKVNWFDLFLCAVSDLLLLRRKFCIYDRSLIWYVTFL